MHPGEAPVTVGDGRYRILSRIGIGGQAAVYKVFDERLRVHRAIKVLLPEFARRRALRVRFESEAQAMAHLDHPNIVRVFDVVPAADLPFIVMELIPGGSLAQWVEQHGPLPPGLALRSVLQTATALEAAHAAGVIHRDVKPHNILVDSRGVCKLGDFGIARAERALRTHTGSKMGTEGYMAPEQSIDASKVDGRADIYGLGVTLWVLLAARDPVILFQSRSVEDLPEAVHFALQRAISVDPRKRQGTVGEFADELRQALARLPEDPPTPPLTAASPLEEVDQYTEISLIFDSTIRPPPSDARSNHEGETGDPPSAQVRGYVMPQLPRRALEGTPDWVEREFGPDRPEQITVGVSKPQPTEFSSISREPTPRPIQRHAAPRTARPSRGDPLDSVREALGVRLRFVLVPPLLLALLVGSFVVLRQREVAHARDEVHQAQATLHAVLAEELGLLDDLSMLGADRSRLEEAWAPVKKAPTPAERTRAALAYADAVEAQVARVAAPGSETWAAALARVQRMRQAKEQLLRENVRYRRTSRRLLGPLAFVVTDPQVPRLPAPNQEAGIRGASVP